MTHRFALALSIVLCLTGTLGVSPGQEGQAEASRPILDPQHVPEWFRTGRFRSARWDGGPLEAEKGVLTGWLNYTPDDPRQILQATRDWYNPKTIEFLKTGHINWAWVTWSNGFSPQTEEKQWDLLRRYIRLCHQNNIRVTAYVSIANIFWKDMFEKLPESIAWVERDFQGGPRFYTHPNRYMADIADPHWLELQRTRFEAAARAGADAFWIDNTFSYLGQQNVTRFIDSMYAAVSKINPRIVIMSNYNQAIYTWAHLQNAVTTEDGDEPGFYPADPPASRMVTNAGLLRYQFGIGEGWRPVSVEYTSRHQQDPTATPATPGKWRDRQTAPMAPAKWQLSIAESAMYGVSYELYFEGIFLRDLYFGEPKAVENLRAIGAYNEFLEHNEEYYLEPESVARVAILSDTTDAVVPYLNELSKTNLNYDVLFNYQSPRPELIARYKAIVLPGTNPLSARWCEVLAKWVENGGTLIAAGDASIFPPGPAGAEQDFGLGPLLGISKRSIPETMREKSRGKGWGVYFPNLPSAPDTASALRQRLGDTELVKVEAPSFVLSNVTRQSARGRLVVHLLNYRQTRVHNLKVRVRGPVLNAEVLSPDNPKAGRASVRETSGNWEVTVPDLLTYDLVVIHLRSN
jgi:hypothetical protein